MTIEIVDFPIDSMVDLSSSLCKTLTRGRAYHHTSRAGFINPELTGGFFPQFFVHQKSLVVVG